MVQTRSAVLQQRAHDRERQHRITLQTALNASILNPLPLRRVPRSGPLPTTTTINPLFATLSNELLGIIVSHLQPIHRVCFALTSRFAFNLVSAIHPPNDNFKATRLSCIPPKPSGNLRIFGDSEYEALMRLLVLFVPEIELYLLMRSFTRMEKKWLRGMTMQEILEIREWDNGFQSHRKVACWIIEKRMARSAKKTLS